jgi:hypothetical protein
MTDVADIEAAEAAVPDDAREHSIDEAARALHEEGSDDGNVEIVETATFEIEEVGGSPPPPLLPDEPAAEAERHFTDGEGEGEPAVTAALAFSNEPPSDALPDWQEDIRPHIQLSDDEERAEAQEDGQTEATIARPEPLPVHAFADPSFEQPEVGEADGHPRYNGEAASDRPLPSQASPPPSSQRGRSDGTGGDSDRAAEEVRRTEVIRVGENDSQADDSRRRGWWQRLLQ